MAKFSAQCFISAPVNNPGPVSNPDLDSADAAKAQQNETDPSTEPDLDDAGTDRVEIKRMQIISDYDIRQEGQIFARADSALAFTLKEFLNGVFKHTFLDRSKNVRRHSVGDGALFNKGIRDYKNELCKTLVDYLKKSGAYPDTFFDKNGAVKDGTGKSYYERLMQDYADTVLPGFDITKNPSANYNAFKTFAAFYALNNFDDLVARELDGIVKITGPQFGSQDNVTYARDESKMSTIYWAADTHEAHGVDKFTSKLVKFIVSQIPKVVSDGHGGYKQLGNQYLTTNDLYFIAGVLKLAEMEFNQINAGKYGFKPIVFMDNPKVALERILKEGKDLPILKSTGQELFDSLRHFLFDETANEYSIKQCFEQDLRSNFRTLDIQALIAFEINNNVTPTYIQYNSDGLADMINRGRKFKSTNKLDYNLRDLLFLDKTMGESQITGANFVKTVKDKTSLALLRAIKDGLFNYVCSNLFGIDDITDSQYDDFLEHNWNEIVALISECVNASRNIQDADTDLDLYKNVDDVVKLKIIPGFKPNNWKRLKKEANRFISTMPITTFKSISGNPIPVYRLSSALFNYNQYLVHYQEDNAERHHLNFLVANPNVFSRYNNRPGTQSEDINEYYETPAGFLLEAGNAEKSISVDKMSPSDQLITHFFGNWVSCNTDENDSNKSTPYRGVFAFLLAPYSDKSSIGVMLANLKAVIRKPEDNGHFSETTIERILASDNWKEQILKIDYYYRSRLMFLLTNNILKTWHTLNTKYNIGSQANFSEFDSVTVTRYLNGELDIELGMTTILTELDKLDTWLLANKFNWDEVAKNSTKEGLELIDNLYYAKYKEGYRVNKSLKWMLGNLKTRKTFDAYMLKQEKSFLASKEVTELKRLVMDPANKNNELFAQFKDWADAKDANGKKVRKRVLLESKLDQQLKQWLCLWNFFRNQYTDLVSKGPYFDKGKASLSDAESKELAILEQKQFLHNDTSHPEIVAQSPALSTQEQVRWAELKDKEGASEYSSRIAGMAKRMVLYPATIQEFEQNRLDGVSPKINVAIVEDAQEEVFNVKGETHDQDIFDGAAYINMFYSLLEDNSSPGKGIHGTKKPLGVGISDDNAALFKYAEFPLDNARVRRSRNNKYDLYWVVKKINSIKFDPGTDITKGIFNLSLNVPKNMVGKRVFYEDGFHTYEVESIYSTDKENDYEITTIEVDPKTGEPIEGATRNRTIKTIDTLFAFWEALGSYNAKELNSDGELEYSDVNNEVIAQYIYRCGSLIDPNGPLTQDNVKQPLRNKMIHMIANKGAVKRGASNINSADSCWDEEGKHREEGLAYFKVSTKNFGIQLDANHHTDMSELTEMSQTISALAANGYTTSVAEGAYDSIATLIKGSFDKVRDMALSIELGKIDSVLKQISRRVIQVLATEKNLMTTQSLIDLLSDDLRANFLLPISDRRFYKVFTRTILSDLNKSSIKRKYTGFGGIINPSSNILLLFVVGDQSYLYEDILTKGKRTFADREKEAIENKLKTMDSFSGENFLFRAALVKLMHPDAPLVIQARDAEGNPLVDLNNKPIYVTNDEFILDPENTEKEVSKNAISPLDYVHYWEETDDHTLVEHYAELKTLHDYVKFKYNPRIKQVKLRCDKPHDLRPQIERWSCIESSDPEATPIYKDTWSQPDVIIAQGLEYFYDKKLYKEIDKVAETKTSTWFLMLVSLYKHQLGVLNPNSSAEQIDQMADQFYTSILQGNDYAKALARRMVMDLRMRTAEAHTLKKDFGSLGDLNRANYRFDFSNYFCGLPIDITKPILEEEDVEGLNDLQNYTVDPAEVILPKLYRTNFMLGNTNLFDIDLQFFANVRSFYKTSLKNQEGATKQGASIDLLIRLHTGNFNVTVLENLTDATEAYGQDVTNQCKVEDGWRLDEDGNRIYRVPKSPFRVFRDANGIETLIIKKNNLITKDIQALLASMRDTIVSVLPFLENLANESYTGKLLDAILDYNYINTYVRLIDQKRNLRGAELINALNSIYIHNRSAYREDLSSTLYESFIRSLDVISARIPTQALQSFMVMRVKALTNDHANNVFVSRWQLWLQGSDMDIDKSYMMGVDVNKVGFYNHWSPLANYTTAEAARLSDKLPMPSGVEYALANEFYLYDHPKEVEVANVLNEFTELISDYILASKKLDITRLNTKYGIKDGKKPFTAIRIAIEGKILEALNEGEDFIVTPEQAAQHEVSVLIRQLNKHNMHKLTEEESKNLVYKAIHEVSLDGRNFTSAYSPIDRAMQLFTDVLNEKEFDQDLRNLDDGVSIFRIQYENAVGKQDVGIMANGLKVFFAMTQYFNKYWNSPEWRKSYRGIFFRTLKIGALGDPNVKATTRAAISDIKIHDYAMHSLATAMASIAQTNGTQSELTFSNDDASLLISSLVSLATDNAKELALAKLNAGLNLACMHIFLTIMGYNAKDIVEYTTSDLFKDLTAEITPSQYDPRSRGNIGRKTWEHLMKKAELPETTYGAEDVEQLYRIYQSAQEMTNLAKLLGINQGVKADVFSAVNVADNFEHILQDTILEFLDHNGKGSDKNNDGTWNESVINHLLQHLGYFIETGIEKSAIYQIYKRRLDKVNAGIKQYGDNDVVDMHRFFTDTGYREFIIDYYDLFKENFNVYDIIDKTKHFRAMLEAFDTHLNVLINSSSRADWIINKARKLYAPGLLVNTVGEDEDKKTLFEVKFGYDDSLGRRASGVFDDRIVTEFLQSTDLYDFTITTKQGKAYTINYGKGKTNANTNLRSFVAFINTVLIPKLRVDYRTNGFVRSLSPDFDAIRQLNGKRKTGVTKSDIRWQFNFDIDHLDDPAQSNKYFEVVGGFTELFAPVINGLQTFMTLLDLFPDANIENGANVKVADLLYLYDQILNFKSFGQGTLDKAFDQYMVINKDSSIPLAIAEIELQHDQKKRSIDMDPRILMAALYRTAIATTGDGLARFSNTKNTIDMKNTLLVNAGHVQTNSNLYYKQCELVLEAIKLNRITISQSC